MTKPHKGNICCWRKVEVPKHLLPEDLKSTLGYYIKGMYCDHPRFAGEWGWTSMVVKETTVSNTIEIETLNSRYTLLKKEAGNARVDQELHSAETEAIGKSD